MTLCPCHSQKPYTLCCQPYHEGKAAETALLLMRSRYSAFALGLVDYILATAFPKVHPSREDLATFSSETQFKGLIISEFIENPPLAFVTFKAILFQKGHDISFTEKSEFEKVEGRWYYKKFLSLNPVENKVDTSL